VPEALILGYGWIITYKDSSTLPNRNKIPKQVKSKDGRKIYVKNKF
jgi:hypothetical protein